MTDEGYSLALVLSGGNALGAYQGGAYQALHERGLEPDLVAGASAGAINGALICGNPAERRLSRLRDLWNVSEGQRPRTLPHAPLFEESRRTAAALATLMTGQPRIFAPRSVLGPWWNPFGNPEPSSLYDTMPLERTLERLVDFNLLNCGTPYFAATAVDVETGEDVMFDNRCHRLTPAHLRASAALLPAFPPVEVEGRMLADPGLSANLPLDVVLAEAKAGDRPLVCIALDLLPLAGPRPADLGDTLTRMQDLLFATQSRRAIAAWRAIFDERQRHAEVPAITLIHLAYSDQQHEVSGKAFDFSAESARLRWDAGYEDMGRALEQLAAGRVEVGGPGLVAYGFDPTTTRGKHELAMMPPRIVPVPG